jgi:hypothetical protein
MTCSDKAADTASPPPRVALQFFDHLRKWPKFENFAPKFLEKCHVALLMIGFYDYCFRILNVLERKYLLKPLWKKVFLSKALKIEFQNSPLPFEWHVLFE